MANILIVDDAIDAAEALARFLEKNGHRVHVVRDGKDALLAVMSEQIDLRWRCEQLRYMNDEQRVLVLQILPLRSIRTRRAPRRGG